MRKHIKTLIVDSHKVFSEICVEKLRQHETLQEYEFKIYTAHDCLTAYETASKCSQNGGVDFIIMDNYIPSCEQSPVKSSEGLGIKLKTLFPNAKLLITASQNKNFSVHKILDQLNPHGFLLKEDVNTHDLIIAMKNTLSGITNRSKSIKEYLANQILKPIDIDELDIKIVREISNGTKKKRFSQIYTFI